MTKQRQNSGFVEAAKSFFGAPDLQHFVKPLDIVGSRAALDESTTTVDLSFFLIAVQSLQLEVRELLVLLDQPLRKNDERFSVIAEVARGSDCRTVNVVAEAPQITYQAIGDFDLKYWSPEELFSKVLKLPSNFIAQLKTIATLNNSNQFKFFQPRLARVHEVAGTQPVQETVELSSYFEDWLGSGRSPILLLGDRGSGKSWQLLHFAFQAYRLHQEQRWNYGPAFFVKLRQLVKLVENASTASSVISEYLFYHHSGMSAPFGGTATLGALFGSGHSVVLVDGFDEMDVVPTDAQVHARLTSATPLAVQANQIRTERARGALLIAVCAPFYVRMVRFNRSRRIRNSGNPPI